jgi:hypothetical protein
MPDFERRLEDILGKETNLRPFVCHGHPAKCPVWVVGHNPATDGDNWWRYWRVDEGFDYASWRESYDAKRKASGKGISATRRRLDRIKARIPDLLETNIYSMPSSRMDNMPASETGVFDLLLDCFKPRVILAHGVKAQRHLASWSEGRLMKCPHLSRVGYAKVDELIEEIKDVLQAGD